MKTVFFTLMLLSGFSTWACEEDVARPWAREAIEQKLIREIFLVADRNKWEGGVFNPAISYEKIRTAFDHALFAAGVSLEDYSGVIVTVSDSYYYEFSLARVEGGHARVQILLRPPGFVTWFIP